MLLIVTVRMNDSDDDDNSDSDSVMMMIKFVPVASLIPVPVASLVFVERGGVLKKERPQCLVWLPSYIHTSYHDDPNN